ncbi:CDP-alcohol phosphatidyltransferase [Microterricola viridarii]|uniref:CDP-alcohol phosphatidyltransferase n=1 Tax=Microterricola viridarii TaxID=412690 RepID=A0A109QYA7_9MICO|nr:CDP-alcohol phosphatidyltransferase [Microterricola viridarii]
MSGALAPASGGRFSTALSGLRSAQKPGAGVPAYTRWVNRRLARFAAAAAYTLGWSANVVTAVSAVLSFAALGLMLFAPQSATLGIAVAALLAAGYVLDSADGQVARLSRSSGPAGEWLDHVVDAIRTPAIHLAVLIGLSAVPGLGTWPLAVAVGYCLLSSGQFMSQILSEQLSGAAKPVSESAGIRQSLVLIPTDMGTLCWVFLLWGVPEVFVWVYTGMFLLNAVHAAVSMRRKYRRLQVLQPASKHRL